MKRLLMLLAALLVAACASDTAGNKADVAPSDTKAEKDEASPVGVIPTALLHDAQRNKDVDVDIEYPTRGGPFPVIIFSHGYGGSNRGYEPMMSYWTSHGYVTIRPSHADAGALRDLMRETMAEHREERREERRERRRDRDREAEKQPPPFRPNPAESIWEKEREPQWRDRARDIILVLDSLAELENRFPELKGKMDKTKVGVGGHSYGAFTAMLLGGMRAGGVSVTDPRVSAVLAMSPQGVAANRGLTAESWRDFKVPALFMTGTRDIGAAESETPDWRKEAYANSPAGDKYFVLIEGAGHMTFAGMATPITPEQDMIVYEPRIDPVTGQQVLTRVPRNSGSYVNERQLFDRIRSIGLTFWDAYLKSDAKAKEKLAPGQLGGNVTLEKK